MMDRDQPHNLPAGDCWECPECGGDTAPRFGPCAGCRRRMAGGPSQHEIVRAAIRRAQVCPDCYKLWTTRNIRCWRHEARFLALGLARAQRGEPEHEVWHDDECLCEDCIDHRAGSAYDSICADLEA